jgi:hypothetical protein
VSTAGLTFAVTPNGQDRRRKNRGDPLIASDLPCKSSVEAAYYLFFFLAVFFFAFAISLPP